MRMLVTVLEQAEDDVKEASPRLEELIERAVRAAVSVSAYVGDRDEVNVLVVDDRTIARYHAEYLGDDNPTDVISFPAIEAGAEPVPFVGPEDRTLGDIVVSADTARAQAVRYGHSFEREMALLVIHGFLHLVGYDDVDECSTAAMRDAETKALALI